MKNSLSAASKEEFGFHDSPLKPSTRVRFMVPASIVGILFHFFIVNTSAAAKTFQVYRSSDYGRNWTRVGKGLPAHARVNAFASLERSTAQKPIFAATDAGIFVSEDSGENWHASSLSPNIRPLCFATVDHQLFVGTERDGILVSTNLAQTWERANAGLSAGAIRSLQTISGMIFAGTDHNGVFKASGRTKIWVPEHSELPAQAQILDLAVLDGTLYAALYTKGLYRWQDGPRSWKRSGTVTPLVLAVSEGTLIAGHNPGGLHWSDDSGNSWHPAALNLFPATSLPSLEEPSDAFQAAPVWALAGNGRRAIAGAGTGIYYSEDRGLTWTRSIDGLPESSPGVAFLAREDFFLAAVIFPD